MRSPEVQTPVLHGSDNDKQMSDIRAALEQVRCEASHVGLRELAGREDVNYTGVLQIRQMYRI